jgi:hypothetical protein
MRAWLAAAGLLAPLLFALPCRPAPAHAESWPSSVRVLYDVNFNGLNIGTFEFQSQSEQQSYTLTGNARLSILLGAFTWDSETRSFGLIVNEGPKPAAFSFDYKSNLNAGSMKIGFSDGSVTDITYMPPIILRPGAIPLRAQHLKGVLDPLSAMMAIAHSSNANPCERRVPIFDGKERFDLVFSYKGQMQVSGQQAGVQTPTAYVCRVKYLPIAGHKIDSVTEFMAANDNIEVALLPFPSANVFVPYQITVPTLAGSATLVSKRVDIAPLGGPRIALPR